jgi:hypothetical protein
MVPTFLLGALSLLGWFFLTSADRTAMRLFWKAVVYFLLAPLLLFPFYLVTSGIGLSDNSSWTLFGFIVVGPIIEEGLKLWAIRTESEGAHVFGLVALFGVFELMLSKPLMMAGTSDKAAALLNSLEAVPALFLHLLTGAIYGFQWRTRRERQFIVCVCIHGSWNAVVTQASAPFVSDWVVLAGIPVFAMVTFYVSPRTIADWRQSWKSLPIG